MFPPVSFSVRFAPPKVPVDEKVIFPVAVMVVAPAGFAIVPPEKVIAPTATFPGSVSEDPAVLEKFPQLVIVGALTVCVPDVPVKLMLANVVGKVEDELIVMLPPTDTAGLVLFHVPLFVRLRLNVMALVEVALTVPLFVTVPVRLNVAVPLPIVMVPLFVRS